jgi:putative acetyltransferase
VRHGHRARRAGRRRPRRSGRSGRSSTRTPPRRAAQAPTPHRAAPRTLSAGDACGCSPAAAAAAAAAPGAPAGLELRRAASRRDLRAFAALTREYYAWLGEDLCFQVGRGRTRFEWHFNCGSRDGACRGRPERVGASSPADPPPPPGAPAPRAPNTNQGIDAELASLPGCYAPPGGAIILASPAGAAGDADADGGGGDDCGGAVGCIAVRPFVKESGGGGGEGEGAAADYEPPAAAPACELKRLWVRSGAQGAGAGRALIEAAVGAARELGYKSVVLDTLERLGAANKLYAALGFRRRAAYYHNPLPNVVYWELDL